ncbi:MAG: TetR/AcrR family transcriptional regulator [Pseudomonadota bacterium]
MPRVKGKEPLTQARILKVAVQYADKHGLEQLSIREIARQLKAGPMSLYHHFENKDDLLDAMVEFVAQKIRSPGSDAHWREGIIEIASSAHGAMLKHPWVCAIWSQRQLGPHKMAYMESLLRVLREGGFSVSDAYDAYCAITVHIEGAGMQAAGFPLDPKEYKSAATGFLESFEQVDQIPYFVQQLKHIMENSTETDHFLMTLEMILDGFASRAGLLPS